MLSVDGYPFFSRALVVALADVFFTSPAVLAEADDDPAEFRCQVCGFATFAPYVGKMHCQHCEHEVTHAAQ